MAVPTTSALDLAQTWTASGDEDYCYLGFSVAVAGDVNGDGYGDVIVGVQAHDDGVAGSNRGRAYVYLGSETGPAATPAWTGQGNENGALFGSAVATAGDVNGDGYSDIIVGAYKHDAVGVDAGQAYVYLGSASGVSTTAAWTGSGDESSARYGIAVSAAGDTNGDGYSDIVVGASLHDAGVAGSNRGRAYVYLGSSTGLSATPVRVYSGDETSALLGISVAMAGDVNGDGYSDILIGASYHDAGAGSGADRGRAYIYLGSASGPAAAVHWTGSGNENAAYFGAALSTAGDVNGDGYSDILVGAYSHDAGAAGSNRGQAYIFLGSSAGTLAAPSWTASGDEDNANFGFSVATAGDVDGNGYADVAVGAPYHNAGGLDRGRAYLFLGSASGLSSTSAWTASGSEDSANLGFSLFTAGDANGDGFSDLVVGAPYHDAGAASGANRGQAYLYLGRASSSLAYGWSGEGNIGYAWYGAAVSGAGDVNGDGYSDVLIGAPYYTSVETREGEAFLYLGSASGLSPAASWGFQGNQAEAYCGNAVASAGDVNGDGFDDVLIAAYGYENGQTGEGRVYLFCGSPSSLSHDVAWSAEGNQNSAFFGSSVAGAGDVNGDGYADVLVGAPGITNGQSLEGRAYLYLGSPLGLGTSPAWTAEGNQAGARFGRSVASAGDVNGDGYSDVVIGAYHFSNGETEEGAAFLYLGSAAGLEPAPAWMAESNQAAAGFGDWVATAGDVDGDGHSDVAVGAPFYDGGQTDEGKVFLFRGTPSGLETSPAWSAESNQASASFGGCLSSAGDVNGDGYSDLLVGASHYDGGSAFVYLGGPSGLGATPAWSQTQSGEFGIAVSSAGDVDGDCFSDIVCGGRYMSNGEYNEGMAIVYFGNDGPGVSLRPQQYRSDGYAPVGLLGRAPDGDFILLAQGRTPMGRGDVKLEWQTVPLGTPFPQAASEMSRSGTWLDAGVGGTPLAAEEVLGGTDGPYCWRMRTLYRASSNPFQRHGVWMTHSGNGRREADLRKTPPCFPPIVEVFISGLANSGTQCTLAFLDGNDPAERTGWNVRRSADPSTEKSAWPLIGWNIQDEDPGTTPQIEWTDAGGNPSAGAVWYYQVTAYNFNCPVEGPF